MYPVIRMVKQLLLHRNDPPLPWDGTHVSTHRCWPWDIDLWMELNNGRTLTLLDLGRIPLASRIGLIGVLRRERQPVPARGRSIRRPRPRPSGSGRETTHSARPRARGPRCATRRCRSGRSAGPRQAGRFRDGRDRTGPSERRQKLRKRASARPSCSISSA